MRECVIESHVTLPNDIKLIHYFTIHKKNGHPQNQRNGAAARAGGGGSRRHRHPLLHHHRQRHADRQRRHRTPPRHHAAGARQYQPATRLSKKQTLVDNINERKTGKNASLFYLLPFIFSITSLERNTALLSLAL